MINKSAFDFILGLKLHCYFNLNDYPDFVIQLYFNSQSKRGYQFYVELHLPWCLKVNP